ncbi:hypothetical protein [Nocardia sp. NPDC057440]|uniref:hypothetical protein n=1 Tax=Nocardia sp. NPDC057440 TaxID=3346134 RepID=UPI00366C7C8B
MIVDDVQWLDLASSMALMKKHSIADLCMPTAAMAVGVTSRRLRSASNRGQRRHCRAVER